MAGVRILPAGRVVELCRVPMLGELVMLEDGALRVTAVTHTPCAEGCDADVQLAPEAPWDPAQTRAALARDPLAHWPDFEREVHARLEQGRVTYGDSSFTRSPSELLAELEQEALDLAGWGYVLWARTRALRTKTPQDAP